MITPVINYLNKYKPIFYSLIVIGLLFNKFNVYASNEQPEYNFSTNITFPDLTSPSILGPTYNNSHKLLLYSGKKDDEYVYNYYRAAPFLGWAEQRFTPLDIYKTDNPKGILATTNAPNNTSLVLSFIDNFGQLLSITNDGINWHTQKINLTDTFFDQLTNTNVSGIEMVTTYGTYHTFALTTTDGYTWQQRAFPNTCAMEEHCVYENKFFGSATDKFVLLQSRNLHNNESNKLFYSSNLSEWYNKSVPFIHDYIQNVFSAKHFDLLFASVIDKDDNHKLWLTPDLTNWVNFDLPNDAEVSDVKVYHKNQIAALLVYSKHVIKDDYPDGDYQEPEYKVTTDLVVIDPETKNLKVMHTFDGKVNHMNYINDKLYLSGDFINPSDNSHAALVSMLS